MDIFNYLEDNGTRIAQCITAAAKNYSTWTIDRLFEEAKKEFESIKDYFARVNLLQNNLKNTEILTDILTHLNEMEKSITSDVEHIVEIHVDEPGFEQSLETIAKEFSQYVQYCEKTVFPAMRKNLSKDDLKHINEQLNQKVLP